MGSGTSTAVDTPLNSERQAAFQEIFDISSTYLEHFEFILESQQHSDDPRQVLAVLKANCQTARDQISKLPTKSTKRRKFSSLGGMDEFTVVSNDEIKQKKRALKMIRSKSAEDLTSTFKHKTNSDGPELKRYQRHHGSF